MSIVNFPHPDPSMTQPHTQGERVATLEAWSAQHEQRCEERMTDMKDLFVEVKSRIARLELAIWAALLAFAGWAAVQLWATVS
jgi:hypothetical protein